MKAYHRHDAININLGLINNRCNLEPPDNSSDSHFDRINRINKIISYLFSYQEIATNRQNPSSPFLVILACPESFLLLILPHPTKKDSRQAGMTDRRGHGFPTSESDRSQRAWISCPFWLSLSPPVKNRQNPSSPFLVILACPESFLLILPHPTKKDSRQAGMTDRRGHGFPTSGNDRSQRAWIPDKRK